MALSEHEIYEDVITKLVACINKTDRKKIKRISIRFLEREGLVASSEPPDTHASQMDFYPKESKMILTSVRAETEVFKN